MGMTVDEYVGVMRGSLKASTARGWSTYLNLLATEFEGRDINSVMSSEIAALRNSVIENAKERAVSRDGASAGEGLVTAARAVWARAIVDEVATKNPALGVSKPARQRARERRALSAEELGFVWTALTTKTADPALAALVYRLALETGARRAEMLGLTTKSLNEAAGTLQIRTGAKNGAIRQQPITAKLYRAMQQLTKDRCAEDYQGALLVNRRGVPITRRWFENAAETVRKAYPELGSSGEVWFTWHLMRHTAAVWVDRAAGFSVASHFLGHKQQMTRNTTILYTTVDLSEVRAAVAAVWNEPMAGLQAESRT